MTQDVEKIAALISEGERLFLEMVERAQAEPVGPIRTSLRTAAADWATILPELRAHIEAQS